MKKHDADRVNAAFSDQARKLEKQIAKTTALEKAIQTQGNEIEVLKKQLAHVIANR